MEQLPAFTGFHPETRRFFAALKRHNNREWFNRNKSIYTEHVLRPAQAFVAAMGPGLGSIYPWMVADAGPGGSIFRIYRDTRFSGDKQPYKTHLGIFFWQSGGKKMDRPGFYFELDDRGVRLYYGWYVFPTEVLKRFRDAVADHARGEALLRAAGKVRRSGISVGGEHYKRIPRGYEDIDPSRADLIRYNTIYTEQDLGKPRVIDSARLVGRCVREWKKCGPIVDWVQGLL